MQLGIKQNLTKSEAVTFQEMSESVQMNWEETKANLGEYLQQEEIKCMLSDLDLESFYE